METSLISAKGQVVIPIRLRKKYGFKPGKKVAFFEDNGFIVLKPMDKSFFSQYAGMLSEAALTKEEYLLWKKEEQKLA